MTLYGQCYEYSNIIYFWVGSCWKHGITLVPDTRPVIGTWWTAPITSRSRGQWLKQIRLNMVITGHFPLLTSISCCNLEGVVARFLQAKRCPQNNQTVLKHCMQKSHTQLTKKCSAIRHNVLQHHQPTLCEAQNTRHIIRIDNTNIQVTWIWIRFYINTNNTSNQIHQQTWHSSMNCTTLCRVTLYQCSPFAMNHCIFHLNWKNDVHSSWRFTFQGPHSAWVVPEKNTC